VALHGFAIDHQLVVTLQNDGDPPRTVGRLTSIDEVNRMLNGDLLSRRWCRLVLPAPTAQRQQIRLRTQGQCGRGAVKQLHPLSPCQGRGQIFLSQVTWVVKRPICA